LGEGVRSKFGAFHRELDIAQAPGYLLQRPGHAGPGKGKIFSRRQAAAKNGSWKEAPGRYNQRAALPLKSAGDDPWGGELRIKKKS